MRDALFRGTKRFADFQRRVGAEPDILAARLDEFVGAGLMELSDNPRHPDEPEYLLTDQGRDLEPVVIPLTTWGANWTSPQGPPIAIERAVPLISELIASHVDTEGPPESPLLIEIFLLGSFAVHIGRCSWFGGRHNVEGIDVTAVGAHEPVGTWPGTVAPGMVGGVAMGPPGVGLYGTSPPGGAAVPLGLAFLPSFAAARSGQ